MPVPKEMKIPAARAAADKQLDKSTEFARVERIYPARFATSMDVCYLEH